MSVSMAGFVFNDALMKLAAEDMNMGQAIFIRGLFATVWIFFIAWHFDALRPLSTAFAPLPVLRTLGETAGTVFFLTALPHIALANASAILQTLPLAVTLGGAVFLKEPVGWRRWMAILAGFVGVLIIIRPGATAFSAYSLLIILAVVAAAMRDLSTRAMRRDIPSLYLSLIASPTVALAGLGMCLFDNRWDPVSPTHFALLLGASIFILVGYQFIVLAMREGDISVVTSFRYTSLLWAILLGVILFSNIPDATTIAGGIIVIASGLYTLYRERVRMRNLAASAEY